MALNSLKQNYDRDGYLVVERAFGVQDLSAVRARTEQVIADPSLAPAGVHIGRESDTRGDKSKPAPADDPVRKFERMVSADSAFQEFARHPRLLELVRALIGPRVKVFRDQMLLKPPGGQDKPPHQDQS